MVAVGKIAVVVAVAAAAADSIDAGVVEAVA